MATTLPVTTAMGLPIAPLGLLLAVDTIPDVFATVGDVSADLTANSIVIAGLFGVRKSQVTIKSGRSARTKTVQIDI